ncbi:MAG: efflux RND transporter periplasmic adaptor subunit [Alphaproteobacteria bacterium]|uniref:Efflux RND transporter periplasmic adaptor subunit n=1 Tax=Candidatus Nitrobium versatile TaxID=2884831 RepID=A0A953J9B2_9BACT|nr:efflux RND transporter periplasmic adaptor subunit [Candidatus Nitrobium versatile]
MANEDLSKLKIEKPSGAAGPVRRRWPYKWIIAGLAVLVLLILYARGVFTPAVTVKVATVSTSYPSQSFTLLNASGYVVAQRKAAVASKTTGRLIWTGVEEGSRVQEGQIIARLENEDVTANRNQALANLNVSLASLEQAKAELNNAAVDFEREKGLLGPGYTTKAEYDAAEARLKKAKAAVESAESTIKASRAALRAAEVALEYTLIRAPFTAVVLTKNADVGDIVTPIGAAADAKAAVVTIADMDSLQVEVDVSESNIGKVKGGQPCEIQLDALPDTRFRGEVHMIVPTADRTKATVLVKVRFLEKDKRILPEMSAKVAFLSRPVGAGERTPRTTVNPAAVVTRNGTQVVFVVREDRVVETPVSLGQRLGEVVEVTSGVKAGERVVISPPEKLKDRSPVKIEEK